MNDYLYALKAWNASTKQQKIAALAQFKHPTVLSVRAFPFLPAWVRADLIRFFCIKKAV